MKKNHVWMQSGRGLLMAFVLGMGACVGEAPDSSGNSADLAADRLANGSLDSPETGNATCAPILQEDCRAKPLTAAQITACEQSKRARYNDCVRVEQCTARFDVAVKACGNKPAESSPNRPAFDACLQRAADALNACIGPSNGPGTL